MTNVAVQTLLSVAIALLLNAGLHGQTLARGLLLFPYMAPSIVVALVFRFMFNDVTGVVNHVLLATHLTSSPLDRLSPPDSALWTAIAVNCWKYTPFMIIVVLGRLQTVPPELYDAGRIDGATRGALFRYVTLPWLLPVLLIAMLLRTIWTATDFDLLFLLAFGGPSPRRRPCRCLSVAWLSIDRMSAWRRLWRCAELWCSRSRPGFTCARISPLGSQSAVGHLQ